MRQVLLAITALLCMGAGKIPQAGPAADRLRAILRTITLPPGFRIDLYAMAPGARALAVGMDGSVYAGTRGSHVWAVANPGGSGVQVSAFAPDIAFHDPNGVCVAPDGVLYVAENTRILAFPPGANPQTVTDQLIPADAASVNHGARVCRINSIDNRLYIAVGQPYNVPPHDRMAEFAEWGIGGIVRMDRDGGHREVFARGIRNSVGLDFNPTTHDLWFTDNQVDGMGDDVPPGELNHATSAGLNFGFPWYGGGHTRTPDYMSDTPPVGVVFPDIETVAHAADLGMIFYTGAMFPAKYRGAIFSCQHGSWNRTVSVGARVMVTFFKPDGSVDHMQPFAEGWRDPVTGKYSGRPVDVATLRDGSLIVSDDQDGAIYRVTYAPP